MEQFTLDKHWDKFTNGKVVVNCKTNELTSEFFKYCDGQGIAWVGGEKLLGSDNNWFNETTTYRCNQNTYMSYANIQYYKEDGYKVVEFTGFGENVVGRDTGIRISFSPLLNSHPTTTTKESIEVIYHKRETIVILRSEGKHYRGVSKCSSLDTYNKEEGFSLAYDRARDNQKEGRY